jgi:hypothetical protein
LGGGEEGEREEREKGIRDVVLGWGSHVNSFAKLAQVTDAQNKACVKRSRVLFRGTPKIVYKCTTLKKPKNQTKQFTKPVRKTNGAYNFHLNTMFAQS